MDFKKIRLDTLKQAKDKIRDSVSEDNYITHTINNIEELVKVTNVLTKRLRYWYDLYLPEFSKKVSDNEGFVKQILKKDKKELMNELNIKVSMGKDLDKKDIEPMINLASKIKSMYDLRDELKQYLEEVMNQYCKNLTVLAGSLLGAKLIEQAGSLRRLALMPSSTIQMLGAEKALFRHLKTGARPPKHGLILQHSIVANAKKSERGKYSRMLADKISIAIKTDYFKGEFIADELRKDLEAKIK